jgi:hypothetical protein
LMRRGETVFIIKDHLDHRDDPSGPRDHGAPPPPATP